MREFTSLYNITTAGVGVRDSKSLSGSVCKRELLSVREESSYYSAVTVESGCMVVAVVARVTRYIANIVTGENLSSSRVLYSVSGVKSQL